MPNTKIFDKKVKMSN